MDSGFHEHAGRKFLEHKSSNVDKFPKSILSSYLAALNSGCTETNGKIAKARVPCDASLLDLQDLLLTSIGKSDAI
jgi:hypothetical protein